MKLVMPWQGSLHDTLPYTFCAAAKSPSKALLSLALDPSADQKPESGRGLAAEPAMGYADALLRT